MKAPQKATINVKKLVNDHWGRPSVLCEALLRVGYELPAERVYQWQARRSLPALGVILMNLASAKSHKGTIDWSLYTDLKPYKRKKTASPAYSELLD
jgi:hypothetical protein